MQNNDAKMIDIELIKKILPHRYPFLMIDRVLDYQAGHSLSAIKNITINEPFFQGHFPHKPVMPGVLIIEALAQAAALLGIQDLEEGRLGQGSVIYLVGVDKARFRRPAGPGDQLVIDVKFLAQRRNIWKYQAVAAVDSRQVASAELLTTAVFD